MLFHHLIRPARGAAAGVLVVFGMLLWLASQAGFLGIPLGLILLSWFFKYAYVLFDHVVRGFDDPPALDINMVNPIDEQRPIAQVCVVLVLAAGVWLATLFLPRAAALSLAALAAFLVPASVAILGLEGNLLKALYPVALGRMIAGLGVLYAAILALIAAFGVVLALAARFEFWLPLRLALGMFALLSLFSTLGGALYERRHELGLETWHSPERIHAKRIATALRDSENAVAEAYGQARIGAHAKAWEMLQAWLAARGHAAQDYRWLADRLARWPERRYVLRLTEDYVERLLVNKHTGAALDAVAGRLASHPEFRPKTAAATLTVARLAVRGGGAPAVARMLLSDFGERFPGDPLVAPAGDLLQVLGR